MKHQIQTTSLAAYFHEILPTLGERQKEVLAVLIRHHDLSNHELAKELGWEINCVTGRMNELRRKGIVVYSQTRKCRDTGRTINAWKYNNPNEKKPTLL